MTELEQSDPASEALKREAYQWVMRLTSGEATVADAEAFRQWRRTSQPHRQAFAEANLLWETLHPAMKQIAARDAGAARAGASVSSPRPWLGRRAFLGGAVAASAAVAGYLVAKPPLDLWPSLSEMAADYRTGIGQQQHVALGDNVSIALNTRTSIAVRPQQPGSDDGEAIELIAGEAAVTAPRGMTKPVVVVAGEGRTTARNARFNVRRDDETVCITCLEGAARIEHAGQSTTLLADQQVIYGPRGLGANAIADAEVVTAWQRGLLVFRDDPLSRVIDEVNRYRPGRIVLTNAELGRRPVLATFRIDRIDEVVPRLQAVFGVRARTLPGGVVLVG